EGVPGEGLDQRRRAGHEDDLEQELAVALGYDVVEQHLGRSRQNEAAEAADQEQPQPEPQAPLARRDELDGIADDDLQARLFLLLGFVGPGRSAAPALDFRGPGGEAACAQPQTCHVRPTRQGRVEPGLWARAPARADCSERTWEGRNWLSRSKYAPRGPTGASCLIDKYIRLD